MATLLSYKSWKGKKGGKEVKSAVSKLGKILLHSTVPKGPLTKSYGELIAKEWESAISISFN